MRWILFAVAAPYAVLVGWLWVALMMVLGAATRPRLAKWGRLHATWRPWVRRVGWKWSTTIGFGICFQPDHVSDTDLLAHEFIHTEQIEDLMALALVVGLVAGIVSSDPWLGLGLYLSGGLWQLPNFITAALRGGDPYRDALHERHAYAEEETKP